MFPRRDFDPSWWDPFQTGANRSSPFVEPDAHSRYSPKFDIRETDDRLIIRADLPGVREQDLDVTLTDCQLVIKGKRELEGEDGLGTCYSAERTAGGFTRTVLLPHRIEADRALAELNHGVLHVVLPRAVSTS